MGSLFKTFPTAVNKLKVVGQNLGQVFNIRYGHTVVPSAKMGDLAVPTMKLHHKPSLEGHF
jgi:hypothetical protein